MANARRKKPLDSLERVRREMAAAYWSIKHGEVDLEKGKAQVYTLGKLVEVLKAERDNDEQLAALLQQLKARLQ